MLYSNYITIYWYKRASAYIYFLLRTFCSKIWYQIHWILVMKNRMQYEFMNQFENHFLVKKWSVISKFKEDDLTTSFKIVNNMVMDMRVSSFVSRIILVHWLLFLFCSCLTLKLKFENSFLSLFLPNLILYYILRVIFYDLLAFGAHVITIIHS